MSVKYELNGRLPGEDFLKMRDAFATAFDGRTELVQEFVRDNLGRDVVYNLDWKHGIKYVIFKLIEYCEMIGLVGALITALVKQRPDDPEISSLLAEMVRSGVLKVV
jgi:hypothetical protein